MIDIAQVITSVLQTGVITFVVYMIIKGLKVEIKTLQSQISNQNKLIETMDKRIQETEKIGELYKKLISDFPRALEDYQEVMTKTKDQTIYHLKSNIEEHQLTIENLKNQTKGNDPQRIQRAASISKLFLNKENKTLLEFLEKLHDDKDVIVNALVENSDFDKVIESLGYRLAIIPNTNLKEINSEDFFTKNRIKTCTYTFNGEFYMITLENEVQLTNGHYRSFKASYNALL